MRFLILFAIFIAFVAQLLNAKPQDSAELANDWQGDIDYGSLDLSSLDEDQLQSLFEQINSLIEMPEMDEYIDPNQIEIHSESEVSALPECKSSCYRIYRPVCVSFNGIEQTIASFCEYENLVRCANAKRDGGQISGIPQISYVHEGSCSLQSRRPGTKSHTKLVPLEDVL